MAGQVLASGEVVRAQHELLVSERRCRIHLFGPLVAAQREHLDHEQQYQRHIGRAYRGHCQHLIRFRGPGSECCRQQRLDGTDHGREDNWFLHVNFWDPHTPYRAPAEFGDPFVDEPLPALTEERRRELVRRVKHQGEEGKVALRNLRRAARHEFDTLVKDGDATEDELARAEKELDRLTHAHEAEIDAALEHKERELLEV